MGQRHRKHLLLIYCQFAFMLLFTDVSAFGQNAAIKYLRADISLRQSFALAPNAWVMLEEALTRPIDDQDRKIVAAAEGALVEFKHGAALQTCDWQMSIEDGPLADTSHRGAIRELVAVVALRARIRFYKDTDAAVSDALDGITAARHLTLDGSIASVLFGYKAEREATAVLAEGLPLLSSAQLAHLQGTLVTLPTGATMGKALKSEKTERDDLLNIAKSSGNREELVTKLLTHVPTLQNDHQRANALVDGCGGTVDGVEACIQQQEAFYQQWISRFDLAPQEFEKAYAQSWAEIQRNNPIAATFTPVLPRLRWAEAYEETRRTLLRAAIAVQRFGPKALDKYLDPYYGRPFSYVPMKDGFELKSNLKENGKELELTVTSAVKNARGQSGTP
jgi:hypothetical protein